MTFQKRFPLYMVGLVLLFLWIHSRSTSDGYILVLSLAGVVYAYGQLILAYKTYLDSSDTTALLTEIRDLLERQG